MIFRMFLLIYSMFADNLSTKKEVQRPLRHYETDRELENLYGFLSYRSQLSSDSFEV